MNTELVFVRSRLAIWTLLLVAFGGGGGIALTNAAEKLNVLMILSDDMRPELACYGAPTQTPNLDRLAMQSLLFERAYCQYPLCNPSRTSMLTGLHPTQTKVLSNSGNFRQALPDHVSLPQLFKNNGYTTVKIGKVFHGGIDDPVSWSEGAEVPGRRDSMKAKLGEKVTVDSARKNDDGKPWTDFRGEVTNQMRNSDQRVVLDGQGESHGDYRTADSAMEAMTRLKDKPFFITCGFTKPHAAPSAPKAFYEKYSPEAMLLPKDFGPFPKPPKGFPAAALTKQNIDLFWNREALPEEAKLMLQSYRASVSWVDWNVGRVLDQLERLGLREKTIVVFWGDHGYHLGEMGKWSKHQSLFEVGTRVPMLISIPKAQGNGKRFAHPVQSVDIYPTLASACGLQAPRELAGHDLRTVIDNPNSDWQHAAYSVAGSATNLHRTVRMDRWRYIEWSGKDGGSALIDEDNDPTEQLNLIEDPAHTATVAKMKSLLESLPVK